jgi:hypothetical protein
MKRREYYRGVDGGWLKKKLAYYKVKREEQGAIA